MTDRDIGSPQTIGTNLQVARNRAGMSQEALARRMDWGGPQIVSQIEKGSRQLKATEAARLAAILRVDFDVLLSVAPFPVAPMVLWRTQSGQPHVDDSARKEREAELVQRSRRYANLERWANEPACRELPLREIDPRYMRDEHVGALAEEMRTEFGFGDVPAHSMMETLERVYGVKVFYSDLSGDGDGSAACVRGDFGSAMLICSTDVPWRRVFSAAHELFHLLTWNSVRDLWKQDGQAETVPAWYKRLETLADHFAGALLLPARALREAVNRRIRDGKLDNADVVQLAKEFGVSLEALLIRMDAVGILAKGEKQRARADKQLKSLWVQASKPHRSKVESPFSNRYIALVAASYQRGVIGLRKAAEYLEVSLGRLTEFDLGEPYGVAPAVTVA